MAGDPAEELAMTDFTCAEGVLSEEDQLFLEREFGPSYEPGRRSLLGRAFRAVCGIGAVAALGYAGADRVSDLAGFVGRAEGAVPTTRLAAAPARPARAPRQIRASAADKAEWLAFRSRFVSPDGRVIDTGNKGVSHTEGQGWGMLFAVAFDDRETFERILGWTTRTLRRSSDALHSWRYIPGAPRPVADVNNATDGDLFIALALWRASYRWNRADYAQQARAIAHDVLRLLVREVGGRTVLLPAAEGFEKSEETIVNPSYYAFIALDELAEAVPSPVWAKVRDDGVALIAEGCFGSCRLPPDWLSINARTGALAPAAGWPARFSYDAVRVPLYLSWVGLTRPSLRKAFTDFWPETNRSSAWVDLKTGDRSSYPAPPGFAAVAKIATASGQTALPRDFPAIRSSPDYYSAALTLLARLAWQETTLV